jgi:hypothetical protein
LSFAYEDKPIEQGVVKLCCKCAWDVRKHVKRLYTGKWLGQFVTELPLYFCQRCGYELTMRDMDIFVAKERGEIL